jgi:cardiolipin synthase
MTHEPIRRINPLRTMPNLLTIARICVAPFLVSAVLEGKFITGFVLFMAAGITDALDGMLARILKQRTILGQYLDPVADKLLLSTLFLVLTHMNLIPVRVTALVFGRDLGILVVAAILYSAAGRREFKPSVFGKANTLAQVTAVASVLLYQVNRAAWIGLLKNYSLYATIALTVASGLHYAWLVTRRATTPAANSASGGGAAA